MTDKFKPQLAVDTEDGPQRYPLWGFPKIDGVRGGCYNGPTLTGRSLDPFKNTALVAKFSHEDHIGFDGELTLYGHVTNAELGDDTLCSLTTGACNRAKLKKGETELPTNLQWNLFDYLHPSVVDLPYHERYCLLAEKVNQLANPNISVIPFTPIHNDEMRDEFIALCLDQGYEGAIFRDPDAKHKHGRATARGNDFWRFKPTSDKDAIVTGYEEAMENQNEAKTNSLGRTERSSHKENLVGKGMVGTILATDVATGKPLRMGPGRMKHDERVRRWEAYVAELQGQKVPGSLGSGVGDPCKYTSLDTGVKDKPRQGRFSDWRPNEDLAKEAA